MRRGRLALAGGALVVGALALASWVTVLGGFRVVGMPAALAIAWGASPLTLFGLVLVARAFGGGPARAWALGVAAYLALGVLYALFSRGNAFDSAPPLQVLFWPFLFAWWDACHLAGWACPGG